MTRREFLTGSMGYITAPILPGKWEFWQANTQEYAVLGPSDTDRLAHFLRDWREPSAEFTIDPALFAKIFRVLREFGGPFIIHSGFRTHSTNRKVGGAKYSQHLKGRAVDFRIPYIDHRRIGAWLYAYDTGGVGLYTTHVHMDTGRHRRWQHL